MVGQEILQMSGQGGGNPPNRTVVFRPSPLQELKQAQPAQERPSSVGQGASLSDFKDDVPAAPRVVASRNTLTAAAAPLLSLLASVRSGRAAMELPRLHGMVVDAVSRFRDTIRTAYPEEIQRRATYALSATADDIVLNLPGHEKDVAEWARRSIVVQFFGENIGGDRFWHLLDQMIAAPGGYADVLELYHTCMACGFEGRYRVMAAGSTEHLAKMQRTYQVLSHPRELSTTELSPHWRGILTEIPRMAFWTPLVLAGAVAALVLVLIYVGFRIALAHDADAAANSLEAFNAQPPMRLTRSLSSVLPMPASSQLQTIRGFLAEEIRHHLVEVVEDASTIRVRATAVLFDSGRADLKPERTGLFNRIADALDTQPGPVEVEGYTDNVRISSSLFPDNTALSSARAENVASLLKRRMKDPSRVSAKGYGDTNALADNATGAGRARNRRVEVVVRRQVQP
jgi:type IV/VI secretion system ImpK/VasF family protein